ncbi:MAG TPA: carboxypeptidase-like regulatory domain-containing protein [Thermoleophilaceae bacterium]|nr:carboxypeptidase-like regulatory domain-containing protein [Thermoleophilaceae bacterium]
MSPRRLLIPVLAALVAAGAGAPAASAAAPRVQQLVVFRDGHALAKNVSTSATGVRVAGRRCAIGARTPLAALLRSRVGLVRLRDFGACSARPGDAAGLLVTGVGADRNRGQSGWVYKVGHRAATAGAADTGGPFGNGRLRRGQRLTWFYCLRAGDCQRTLELRATAVSGGVVATVRGYDDAGAGVLVEGATVSAAGVTGTTGADGRVQLALPPGTHRVVARKDGLVRSYTERVEVP